MASNRKVQVISRFNFATTHHMVASIADGGRTNSSDTAPPAINQKDQHETLQKQKMFTWTAVLGGWPNYRYSSRLLLIVSEILY